MKLEHMQQVLEALVAGRDWLPLVSACKPKINSAIALIQAEIAKEQEMESGVHDVAHLARRCGDMCAEIEKLRADLAAQGEALASLRGFAKCVLKDGNTPEQCALSFGLYKSPGYKLIEPTKLLTGED